jgi:hypothetical protein
MKKTITLKSSTAGSSLSDLNKLNRQFLASIEDLGWQEASFASKNAEKMTSDYRNKLLSSLAGKTVTVKGFVMDKTSVTNYTIALASIYIDGCLIDTLHHINVYVDILSNASNLNIGGQTYKGCGKYDVRELTRTLEDNKLDNVTFSECQPVEFTGICYSYKDKWSVGTKRQAGYGANY